MQEVENSRSVSRGCERFRPADCKRGNQCLPKHLSQRSAMRSVHYGATFPTEVQHDLFEAAVRSAGEDAREKLAIFLHAQHPRTTDGSREREVPEPDSL